MSVASEYREYTLSSLNEQINRLERLSCLQLNLYARHWEREDWQAYDWLEDLTVLGRLGLLRVFEYVSEYPEIHERFFAVEKLWNYDSVRDRYKTKTP